MPRPLRTAAVLIGLGAALGALIGGIGGRFLMYLLRVVNESAKGLTSDDGFVIGQVTFGGTVNLMVVSAVLGVLGAAFYGLFRGLMIGPRWFQVVSVSFGSAAVVGALLVHTDGVDFTALGPLWLTVGGFVLVPAAFVVALTLTAEPRLGPPRRWRAHPVLAWAARGGLAAAFLIAVTDLIDNVATLT